MLPLHQSSNRRIPFDLCSHNHRRDQGYLVHAIDGCARWVLMVGWIDQLYRNPANNIHLWSGSHNAHNSVGARRCNIHNLSWSFNEFQFISECEFCSHHGTTSGFDVILTVGVLGRWLRFQRATWWFHKWIRHLPSQQAGLLCWLLYVPLSCCVCLWRSFGKSAPSGNVRVHMQNPHLSNRSEHILAQRINDHGIKTDLETLI